MIDILDDLKNQTDGTMVGTMISSMYIHICVFYTCIYIYVCILGHTGFISSTVGRARAISGWPSH